MWWMKRASVVYDASWESVWNKALKVGVIAAGRQCFIN